MPAPPPPPPPPPSTSSSTNSRPKANENRALLLSEIHHGTHLKKVVTNDRSAPAIGGKVTGKSETSSPPKMSSQNKVASSLKPQSVNESLGALFASGIPRKPSDVKSQKSTSSTSSSVGHTTSSAIIDKAPSQAKASLSNETNNSSLASIKSAPTFSQTSTLSELKKRNGPQTTSAVSLPPPLPTKIQKTNANQPEQKIQKIATSQQTQFQTLRPTKTQPSSAQGANIRRSESNEEIQKRPPNPPPLMRRPGAPPPPPPPISKPNMPSKMPPPRQDVPVKAPAPPPRVSSYLESMEQRFHFVPISELPPPPRFIGFYKDYGDLEKRIVKS